MTQFAKKGRFIVVANWKMNPVNRDEAKRIARTIKKTAVDLKKSEVIIAAPYVYLPSLIGKNSSTGAVYYAAQDVNSEPQGSYTGEVSAEMLKDIDCSYVIVGHSERRSMGETDSQVAAKAAAAIRAGLRPIVCVGEAVHDPQGAYLGVVGAQIKASLALVERSSINKVVIAYEPIWAIGAKEAMSPDLIQEMMIFVRKTLSDMYGQEVATEVPVLYGGTVNARNVKDIVEKGATDGLLVGRESINREGFKQLLKIADDSRCSS